MRSRSDSSSPLRLCKNNVTEQVLTLAAGSKWNTANHLVKSLVNALLVFLSQFTVGYQKPRFAVTLHYDLRHVVRPRGVQQVLYPSITLLKINSLPRFACRLL
jgi:hypothetical protein